MTQTKDAVLASRQKKDNFFKSNPHSPLAPEARMQFEGLAYYDYNSDLVMTVRLTEFDEKKPVPIQTTTGDGRIYQRYGEFTFMAEGEEARLTVYSTPHGFFLPFVDANAGTETYPAGRYLDLEQNSDGTFEIDFNLAYNPYCAYNETFSCPLTPAENRLKIAIRAGEKTFGKS
ncbi:MAG: DUF1684 domain-containing protein [Aggregatilineales bacterium]